jgi:dihydrodipicolinate reductase
MFAKGVFKVATWFMKQKPGKIYDMDDFIDHLLA